MTGTPDAEEQPRESDGDRADRGGPDGRGGIIGGRADARRALADSVAGRRAVVCSGRSEAVAASSTYSDGDDRDDDDIILRRSGLIQLVGLAALVPALTLTASCSDDVTPTNPTGLPQVAGTWTGTYRIASCTDTLNGAPGTLCASLTSATAVRPPMMLTLQQTGRQIGREYRVQRMVCAVDGGDRPRAGRRRGAD